MAGHRGQAGLEGGCACGAVRYRLRQPAMFVHCCHCRDCQTQSGSAFALNALVESAVVETLSGLPQAELAKTDSGAGQQLWRCPQCKVAVWSNYGGTQDVIRFVRVGTLDDPRSIVPDIHIYTRSMLPWVRLPEGAASVEAYYDMKQVWPADSLGRLQAAHHG